MRKTTRYGFLLPDDSDVIDVNALVNANASNLDSYTNALATAAYPTLATYSDGQLFYRKDTRTFYRAYFPPGAITPLLVPYFSSSANARKGTIVNRTLTGGSTWTTAQTGFQLDTVTPGSNWPGGNGMACVSGNFECVNQTATYPVGVQLGFQLWLYINSGATASLTTNVAFSRPIVNISEPFYTNAGTEQGASESMFGEVPFSLTAGQYTFSIYVKTNAWTAPTSGVATRFGLSSSPYTNFWSVNHLGDVANQL